MIDTLNRYYKAWENKDIKAMKKVLHPQLFGIRTYLETVYFDCSEIIGDVLYSPIVNVKLIVQEQIARVVKYTLVIKDTRGSYDVVAKAIIKDKKIYKIYEEIKKDTTRLRCECMYDGSSYSGYQKQVREKTIQQTLEEAFVEALHLKEPPIIHASGRTDKGVHAMKQVFHTDINTQIPIDKMQLILNNHLPDSIYITSCKEVDQTFHSRYDIVSKEYRYSINTISYNPIQRHYEWFVPHLDLAKFKKALQEVVGTHDFQSFTKSTDKSTVRTIEKITYIEDENHLYVHITGSGFLRYMARYIIGAAVQISQGKLPYTMKELLVKKDPALLQEMAPASGLYLYDVTYVY